MDGTEVYDVAIIGAGPAGLATAYEISRLAPGCRVLLLEAGRFYNRRFCPVDAGRKCKGCGGICNVISGFGGCMHYGDGIKLSLMPSGKRLIDLFGEDNAYELSYAASKVILAFMDKIPIFRGIHIAPEIHKAFEICDLSLREFPVAVISESDLKMSIEALFSYLSNSVEIALETSVVDIDKYLGSYVLTIKARDVHRKHVFARKVVFATGRRGLIDSQTMFEKLAIPMKSPKVSIGVRFEMCAHYLKAIGLVHPDVKVSQKKEAENKTKTFCFCGGINGGRIKFTNYQHAFGDPIIVLDGHETCEREVGAQELAGNFGLLCQIDESTEQIALWLEQNILAVYRRISGGRPVVQSLRTFLARVPEPMTWVQLRASLPFEPSVKDLVVGPVYELFTERDHATIVTHFQQLMSPVLQMAGSDRTVSDLLDEILVIGLELEFLWKQISIDGSCETPQEGLFVIGDSAGLAQGIIQAMMMGLQVARRIAKVLPIELY